MSVSNLNFCMKKTDLIGVSFEIFDIDHTLQYKSVVLEL